MNKKSNQSSKKTPPDVTIGEGFADSRGYFPESAHVPKHNGLNVNNDPQHQRDKENEKKSRRS